MILKLTIGPRFFETSSSKGLVHTILSSLSYSASLHNHVIPTLKARSSKITVFMYYGALRQIAVTDKQPLFQKFGGDNNIIRKLSDSNPCNFRYWRLKDYLYREK